LAASTTTVSSSPVRSIPFEGAEGALALPISIIYRVLHTNNPIILQHVGRAGDFAKDAYLLAHKPQSVLCIVRGGT
jgi:hypothetical protein